MQPSICQCRYHETDFFPYQHSFIPLPPGNALKVGKAQPSKRIQRTLICQLITSPLQKGLRAGATVARFPC